MLCRIRRTLHRNVLRGRVWILSQIDRLGRSQRHYHFWKDISCNNKELWVCSSRFRDRSEQRPRIQINYLWRRMHDNTHIFFWNCADCQPRITKIKTAEGGMVMETTHMCMKTYYVGTRTGEIRPITTKAFICSKLGTDLITVKSLNFQGYSVTHHPDPN